jgi:hypothetical protein
MYRQGHDCFRIQHKHPTAMPCLFDFWVLFVSVPYYIPLYLQCIRTHVAPSLQSIDTWTLVFDHIKFCLIDIFFGAYT